MHSLSTSQSYIGIERETPRNLAIAIVLGDTINSSNKHVTATKFFKILHIQFVIEKLITGFYTCSDIQHGLCIKFKVERSTQYVNGIVNDLMTFYRYNNGTNYCVEKYHLIMDKIRKDQEKINAKYNHLDFEKDEQYNCYFLIDKPDEIVYEEPKLSLVPRLKEHPKPELKIVEAQNDNKSIPNDPSFDYFEYLFTKVKTEQNENTIDFLFNLLNQYVSYSFEDITGSIEKFEETTLLQFMIIPEKSQFACICKLLNILSE